MKPDENIDQMDKSIEEEKSSFQWSYQSMMIFQMKDI